VGEEGRGGQREVHSIKEGARRGRPSDGVNLVHHPVKRGWAGSRTGWLGEVDGGLGVVGSWLFFVFSSGLTNLCSIRATFSTQSVHGPILYLLPGWTSRRLRELAGLGGGCRSEVVVCDRRTSYNRLGLFYQAFETGRNASEKRNGIEPRRGLNVLSTSEEHPPEALSHLAYHISLSSKTDRCEVRPCGHSSPETPSQCVRVVCISSAEARSASDCVSGPCARGAIWLICH